MASKFRTVMWIPLAALLGCGMTPTSNPSGPSTASLSGDWLALALPNPSNLQLPTPIVEFSGSLQFNGSSIAGILHAADPEINPCVSFTQDLQATGTIDSSNHLSLTIPISGGVATITATLPSNPMTYIPATWQIIGGACAMPATSISLAQFAPVTGTYTGTFNAYSGPPVAIVPGSATAISAVLTQSTTPNADGQFPLSGTITASGACSGSFTLTNEVVSGGGIGPSLGFPTPPLVFTGAIEPTGTTLMGAFFSLTNCNSQAYSGRLTRQ
ncbi:MAG TPA: hypothetical protein VGU23_00340 [Acidobacteriaceae bacterium]|nr:hypothetical protein [Acidobacteriaceae bacterium]